jgi:hypothetical protein
MKSRTLQPVLDRLGHHGLARRRLCGDAGTDRDREPSRLAIDELALACVDASADVDPKVAHALSNIDRASDRTSRAVKRRVEPSPAVSFSMRPC